MRTRPLHVGRRHDEDVCGAPIEPRIERDAEPIGGAFVVAPHELPRNLLRVRIEHPGGDVDRRIVVEDAHFGAFICGSTLNRRTLHETAGYRGLAPRGIVQLPINGNRPRPADRCDGWFCGGWWLLCSEWEGR